LQVQEGGFYAENSESLCGHFDIGGVFDDYPKFEGCREFFELAREGQYKLVISDITRSELALAPQNVRDFLDSLPHEEMEVCFVNEEIEELGQKYVEGGVLSDDDFADAMHVATATINEVDYIVSCNFKHLVRASQILHFNAINFANGYTKHLDIRRPGDML